MTRCVSNRQRPRRSGFTLVEVLMAMLILAIGLVAIASIFPVAGYLQKQANDDVTAMHVSDQVRAMLTASPIDLGSLTPTGNHVVALPAALLDDNITTSKVEWPVRNRCFPSALDLDNDGIYNEKPGDVKSGAVLIAGNPDPDSGAADPEDSDYDQRAVYWVPLIQKIGTEPDANWRVFVFVLGRKLNATYLNSGFTGTNLANPGDGASVPKVVKLATSGTVTYDALTIDVTTTPAARPGASEVTLTRASDADHVQAGDVVLTSHGRIMRVVDVVDNKVYLQGDIRTATMPTGTPTLNGLWIGLPPQQNNNPIGPSSTLRIVALGKEAVK